MGFYALESDTSLDLALCLERVLLAWSGERYLACNLYKDRVFFAGLWARFVLPHVLLVLSGATPFLSVRTTLRRFSCAAKSVGSKPMGLSDALQVAFKSVPVIFPQLHVHSCM